MDPLTVNTVNEINQEKEDSVDRNNFNFDDQDECNISNHSGMGDILNSPDDPD
jgi:hypothetical protein